MVKKYTPREAAIKVLQKAEELYLSKSGMLAGLKPTKLTPVPGVISPSNSNTASPTKVGSQAVVKTAKPHKLGQALDKPSQFFKKSEEKQALKKPSIKALHEFLTKQKSKQKG